jgi:hypothetical protein
MTNSFYRHIRSHFSRITGFPVHWMHASLGFAGLSIFEARERLKANCRNRASSAFLINLGNRLYQAGINGDAFIDGQALSGKL